MVTYHVRSATPPTAKCKSKDHKQCEFEWRGMSRINQSVTHTWQCSRKDCRKVIKR